MKKNYLLLVLATCSLTVSFNWNEYKFKTLAETSLTYEELSASSEKTILFLWTTWCYYCRSELKRINSCSQDSGDIKRYYVNLGEEKKDVERLAKRIKLVSCITDNIILDERSALAHKFDVIGVPVYIFFKDGRLVHKTHFITDELIEKIYANE